MGTALDELRRDVAIACRVLAHRGLVEDILGHISLRVDGDHALVRCRGSAEAGLRFTEIDDIRLVGLSTGSVVDDATGTYSPPGELAIHLGVLGERPDVDCVVHTHPPDVVTASLAEVELLPIFGAYNIPAMRLAEAGIRRYPRAVLIRNGDLAAEMVESLGEASAVVLEGHGLVTTGRTVAEAVLRALHVETLARMTLAVKAAGAMPRPIPAADAAELPDLGAGFNEATLWRHHLAALDADGWGLKDCR